MLWRVVQRVVTVTIMASSRADRVRSLRALADISWLTVDQLDTLAGALKVTGHEMRSTIFSDKSSPESAYILLSGVARITCVNRKGRRTTAIILSPGLIPAFPAAVEGITYNFRCELYLRVAQASACDFPDRAPTERTPSHSRREHLVL